MGDFRLLKKKFQIFYILFEGRQGVEYFHSYVQILKLNDQSSPRYVTVYKS